MLVSALKLLYRPLRVSNCFCTKHYRRQSQLTESEKSHFNREMRLAPWDHIVSSKIKDSDTPQQIAGIILSSLSASCLKSGPTRDTLTNLISKNFKFMIPFYQQKDILNIMRLSLRLEIPKDFVKNLSGFLMTVDQQELGTEMLLLYECICQTQIKFSIGKDQELYQRLQTLGENDLLLVKEFLSIADIAETFFPTKIIALLCEQSTKRIDKFDEDEILEVFRVVSKIKDESKSFVFRHLTPFLNKCIASTVASSNVKNIQTMISTIYKSRLDYTPLIQDIANNPDKYRPLCANFEFRQALDVIYIRKNDSVPQQFKQDTKQMLVKYFQNPDSKDLKPLEYFLRNMGVFENKHRELLSKWFDVVSREALNPKYLRKLLKFGGQFGTKEALIRIINGISKDDKLKSFDVVLNVTAIIRFRKLDTKFNSILDYTAPSNISTSSYNKLVDILISLPETPERDKFISKIQKLTVDILESHLTVANVKKVLQLHLSQKNFKQNKLMYVMIQHALVRNWKNSPPTVDEAKYYRQIFTANKVGSQKFKTVNDGFCDGKGILAVKKLESYLWDLKNNNFKHGAEWID